MQRNFDPMRKLLETWQRRELTDVTAKVVIYEAFVEGNLDAPKHLARTVHDLYFEPKYEEFRPRTIWSLSNAFTSAFKDLESHSPVQGDSQAGRISRGAVFTIVLASGGGFGSAAPPPQVIALCFRQPMRARLARMRSSSKARHGDGTPAVNFGLVIAVSAIPSARSRLRD